MLCAKHVILFNRATVTNCLHNPTQMPAMFLVYEITLITVGDVGPNLMISLPATSAMHQCTHCANSLHGFAALLQVMAADFRRLLAHFSVRICAVIS